ncbi:MAG: hypothetical protein GKR89_25800 [Candidatus Latescibacteria bacterium]|nr:hypothetical protein [Candidatus Latescibacterota bacterium]
MKVRLLYRGLVLLWGTCLPLLAQADPPKSWRLDGAVGLRAKYNSNLDLREGQTRDSAIGEAVADIDLGRNWQQRWWLDLAFSSRADFHADQPDDNWYFNRGHLALARTQGANTYALSSEWRHFTVPGADTFDFIRHTGLLTYKRDLDQRWQIQLGYQNINTQYLESPDLDYVVNGGLLQIRTRWTPFFSTYFAYDTQYYKGNADPQNDILLASPDEGKRQTGRFGFDWLISPRHILSGTGTVQTDATETGLQEIGEFEGFEDSLEDDAEFDFFKLKSTLLYTFRPTNRLTLTAYQEWIYRDFEDEIKVELIDGEQDDENDDIDIDDLPVGAEEARDEDEFYLPFKGRSDASLLSSLYGKYRWTDSLALKFRYLLRVNRSSAAGLDYIDHIVFFGPEYSF